MTSTLMANCKFCKSNNTETLQTTFSLCKDCNCIFNQNFSSRKKSYMDNNHELKSSSIIHDTVKMRFWDVISQQYIAYLKSKTDMKFNNAIDIGALYGHLVKRLNDLGINSSGIEADKNQVSHDISGKLSHGYFDETFQIDKKFDLICLTQMIYYVENPALVIKKAAELLNDSGIIFISTQNPESPVFLKSESPPLEPTGNILLSKSNFLHLTKELDLKLVDFKNFNPKIYLDRQKNQAKLNELFNYFKYYFKSSHEEDADGHHSFLLLSKK